MNRENTLNTILNRFTVSFVQLRRERKTEALNYWQPIVYRIVEYVKRDDRFAALKILGTGSYYERTKVGEPDEFDLMLVLEDMVFREYESYEVYANTDGMSQPPTGFTRVINRRHVQWHRDSCVNAQGMFNASQVKAVFARLVRDAIQVLGYDERFISVRSHGPAVTLQISNRSGRVYSVDLALAIQNQSWPTDAKEWSSRPRIGWPSHQLKENICQGGCHMVVKQPKGSNVPDHEKPFLWRYSFSAAEKELALRGGQGEASSCRKQVLRILKALKEERNLHPLKSYHLKTILFYECEDHPDPSNWSFDCLGDRLIGLLKRLENCLSQSNCPHYFIKHFNLFEMFPQQKCAELAVKVNIIIMYPEEVFNRLIEQH